MLAEEGQVQARAQEGRQMSINLRDARFQRVQMTEVHI